jgi:hypothetical protein
MKRAQDLSSKHVDMPKELQVGAAAGAVSAPAFTVAPHTRHEPPPR